MNTKHISLAFATVAALLAGCAKSSFEEPIDGQFADLELSYVGATETKAAIDGTTFPMDGEIGLFFFEDETATTPYGDGYVNVKYSYNSTKRKWTASPSIKVGSTPGYLYGYYPYSSAATDIKAIPVSSSLNGDDVMYAAKQSIPITDETASQTTIMMNHALARVSVKVINNGYAGNAKLSQIKFEGAKLAASGTLNALDGKITATKADEVALSVPTAEQTIATGDGTTYECLLVPSEINSNRQDVTLSLTIDGQDKTATLSGDNGVIFAQGIQSNITITLSNSGISVRTVSVEDWNVVEVGGHKVTIKMAENVTTHDVLTDVYVDENSVIVNAWSKSGKHLKCTMSDGEFCTSQSKTSNLVYTFTISDITSSTTATIGYIISTNIAVSPANAGYIEIDGGATYVNDYWENYFEGETFKHKAIPNEGWFFVNWQDQYGNILCESEEYTFRPSSKVDVTAVFQRGVSLKVFVSPSFAGSVSAFENINLIGTDITLTTTPCGNSVFNGWKDKDGNILSIKKTYAFTIESDTILIADYSVDCGTDALNGVFTVAADNGYGKPKKVRFSKGNLWYGETNGASSKTFNFEDDQFAFQINYIAPTWGQLNHISHFMWSKDAEYSISQYFSESELWGNDVLFTNSSNFAVNGVSVWCTLSQIEWAYLLNSRATTYGSGELSTDNHRYAEVKVNDISGLLIFPDEFTWPSGAGDEPSTFNAASSDWNGANYTDTAFEALQAAGCVFLPAAGYRYGLNGNTAVYDAGYDGYYWSASPLDGNVYCLLFTSSDVFPNHIDGRFEASAVRLVTESN